MPSAPATFRPRHAPTPAQARREADHRRGSARARGYDAWWDRASRAFLREHPLCLGCQAVGLLRASELTDHIVPHQGDRAKFRNRGNWQPSCGWHHDAVKQRLERMHAQGKIDAAALRLDSAAAIALTRELRGEELDVPNAAHGQHSAHGAGPG